MRVVTCLVLSLQIGTVIAQNTVGSDYAILIATDIENQIAGVGPVLDATTIGKELNETYGYEVQSYLNLSTSEFADLQRSIRLTEFDESDRLFVFIAGPCENQEGGNALLLKDSKRGEGVDLADLVSSFDHVGARQVMVMIDACSFQIERASSSGTVSSGSSREGPPKAMASRQEFLNHKLSFRSRMYVSSGSAEYIGAIGQKHSPLTSQFLAALRDYGGRDGILTKSELLSYLKMLKVVPQMGDFGSSEPGGDYLFMVKF